VEAVQEKSHANQSFIKGNKPTIIGVAMVKFWFKVIII
jgi:hypothetical protein